MPEPSGWRPSRDVRDLVGPLADRDVVDLGCGDGVFARWALGQGASWVLGLDLSTAALERARAGTEADEQRVRFEQADLEQVTLPFEAYDVAHAAVALDAVDDPLRLLRAVRAGMRPRGRLVARPGRLPSERVAALLDDAGWLLADERLDDGGVLLRLDKPRRGGR